MDEILLIPLDRLPNSPNERHAVLRDYFCDKDAVILENSSILKLKLEWSNNDARYVDPYLREGLDWWQHGLKYSEMALARRREGKILHTLYDTWTLLSWSEWLTRQEKSYLTPLTVLHIDDHKDIGSPRVFIENEIWLDAITEKHIELLNPMSVSSAIGSGAISIGSFITPLLHKMQNVEVRHLCQPPKAVITQDFKINPIFESDTLLDPTIKRLAVELTPSPISNPIGFGRYRLTPSLGDWLDGVGDNPILLHIDMDYFSNRYDGDSDWNIKLPHLNKSLDEVFSKIDELIDALQSADIMKNIEDIVIAYSPGFFPAEYWCEASSRLTTKLNNILE